MRCREEQAIIDHLVEQFGLEQGQVEAMLSQFLPALDGYRLDLGTAIDAGQPVDIAAAAHKIKGSLYNLGLTQAGDLALQIETHAKSSQNADYPALYQELTATLSWLSGAL